MTPLGNRHRIVPLEVGSPKEFNKKSDFFFSSDVKELGCTVKKLNQKGNDQRKEKMPKVNKRWKIADLEFIRENYPTMCQRRLAAYMGISQNAVESAIRRYQIKKKP